MTDLTPVPRPSSVLDGWGGRVATLIALAMLIAFIKPWGPAGVGTPQPSIASAPSPSPSPSPSASPSPTPDLRDAFSRRYDPLIFGDKELRPGWGLWPAGYMVSFGFAMHVEPQSAPSGGPSPSSSGLAQPGSPDWPVAIEIPYGNHLLLVGVNTPEGYSIGDVQLTRYEAGVTPVRNGDDGRAQVPIVRPLSPWPSHFTVIGVDAGYGVERTALWTPGRYRMDIVVKGGTAVHSIEILVDGPPDPDPTAPPVPEAP